MTVPEILPALPVLTDISRNFQVVPVCDDGFAPMLRTGEFAVVDVRNREPEVGAFVFVKGANPGSTYSAIVRLYNLDRSIWQTPEGEPERQGPLWATSFGRQLAFGLVGDSKEYFSRSDGPMEDDLIREMIVGRIVGVMRAV